jgi:hypothetical protein
MILAEIREILVQMSPVERASALSFLAAVIADAEVYPSCNNPRVMQFMMRVPYLSTEEQISLAALIGGLLKHPELLDKIHTECERRRAQYEMN